MLRLSFSSRLNNCMFQCRSSCSMTPKYWTWDVGSIFLPLMQKLRYLVTILFLGLNISISVLLVLSYSLFALIQSTLIFKSLLICLLIFLSDLPTKKRLLLWTNRWTELILKALCKLLINKIKRRTPRTKRLGTLYLTDCLAEWQPWTLVNCFRSFRNDWNHLLAIPLVP